MNKLYTEHGGRKNGNIVLPATNKQVIDYCLSNPELMDKLIQAWQENKEYICPKHSEVLSEV